MKTQEKTEKERLQEYTDRMPKGHVKYAKSLPIEITRS